MKLKTLNQQGGKEHLQHLSITSIQELRSMTQKNDHGLINPYIDAKLGATKEIGVFVVEIREYIITDEKRVKKILSILKKRIPFILKEKGEQNILDYISRIKEKEIKEKLTELVTENLDNKLESAEVIHSKAHII